MDITTLGEFDLIARLTQGLPTHDDIVLGVGDDCAILPLDDKMWLLSTCDSQVEGIHFTLQTSRPEEIGRKALAINVSDIAAMGGEPRYALVSLLLSPQLSLEQVERIYAGLREEAELHQTQIVGGNIASSGGTGLLAIDITLLGRVERGHALLRSGAHVGDMLYVTGTLGDSAAGLYTLLHPEQEYPPTAQESVLAIHRVPRPRVREGRLLSTFAQQGVTALLDISDGLSGDLGHLCERSRVGACIEAAALPLSQAMRAIAQSARQQPLQWALHGGEDYELLFTVAPEHEASVLAALRAATATPISKIGSIRPSEEGMSLRYPDGHQEPLSVQSWDHLRP